MFRTNLMKISCLPAVIAITVFASTACQGTREAQNGYSNNDEPISESAKPDIASSRTVEVKITDAAIEMPISVPAGTTTFTVTNTGTAEHDFRIEGVGVDKKLGVGLKPGESGTLQVELTPGSYKVTCPTAGSADLAMNMQFELVVTQ